MKDKILIGGVILLLTACATDSRKGGYYQDDGPHSVPHKDVDAIANAIPRMEPLSESGNKPYVVFGKTYYPSKTTEGYNKSGVASWYGKKFHGNKTSSGEVYDMYGMTAAHKTLPLPSYVKVRNLDNNKSVIVRVNDRGPFLHNRLIDLSYAAAKRLGIVATGTGRVEVSTIGTNTSAIEAEPLSASQHTGVETIDPTNVLVNTVATTNNSITTDTPSVDVVDETGLRIYLQLGAFSEKSNAENLMSKLTNTNMGNIFIQDKTVNNVPMYRVRIGPLKSVKQSAELSERVKQHGIWDARVIIE